MGKNTHPGNPKAKSLGPQTFRSVIKHAFTGEIQVVTVFRHGPHTEITWPDGYKERPDDRGMFSGSWRLADSKIKSAHVATKRVDADAEGDSRFVESPVITQADLDEFASLIGVSDNKRRE